jgi:hypothetical protein
MEDAYYITSVDDQSNRLIDMIRTVDTAISLIEQLTTQTVQQLLTIVDESKRETYQVGNKQINNLEDGIDEQRTRLGLLYYDPSEDLTILQATKNSKGFYACTPGVNQAHSFRNHIRQLHQFAHPGFYPDASVWKAHHRPGNAGYKYLYLWDNGGTPSPASFPIASFEGTYMISKDVNYRIIAWGGRKPGSTVYGRVF